MIILVLLLVNIIIFFSVHLFLRVYLCVFLFVKICFISFQNYIAHWERNQLGTNRLMNWIAFEGGATNEVLNVIFPNSLYSLVLLDFFFCYYV